MASALLKPTRHDVYPFIDPKQNLTGAAAGKSVLITGAGTGIGRGIAESFALAGATSLILAARRADPLEETKSIIAALAPKCNVTVAGGTDIASEESINNLFTSLPSPPDVLVSNAAVASQSKDLIDSDPATWWRDIDINLRGSYNIARAYLRAVRAASSMEKGLIINVSSNGAWRFIPGQSSYSASKLALNKMTEYIDGESQRSSGPVRCVAMHPGGVLTELGGGGSMEIPPAIRAMLIDKPALPGGTAVYLSTEGAEFLMGRFVSATWDMEELEKVKDEVVREDLLKSKVLGVA